MGDIPFNPNKITNVPGMNQSADMSSVMVDKRGIGDLSATEVNLIINPATVPSRRQKREIFNKIADKEAREADHYIILRRDDLEVAVGPFVHIDLAKGYVKRAWNLVVEYADASYVISSINLIGETPIIHPSSLR